MSIMTLTLMFILGFLFGKIVESVKEHIKAKKILTDGINQFTEIFNNLKKGHAVFISRVNQTVMIDTKLKDSVVNIVYLMDKRIVCIFKESKCIYTSEILTSDFNNEIITKIHEQYGKEIEDVVEILGVTISREELENKLKDFEKFNPNMDLTTLNKKDFSEVEKIIEENEERFDVDSILDKIGRVGMEKITQEELEFLKNQSKK